MNNRTFPRLGGVVGLAGAAWALAAGLSAPAPTPGDKAAREITNSIGMKLVRIQAGRFTMGSPQSETPLLRFPGAV